MNHYALKILIMALYTGLACTGCVSTRLRVDGIRLERYIQQTETAGKYFIGFVLTDPESGKTLIDYQGDRFFTPASNTKLVTLYASKKILGDSIPSIAAGIRNDTLFFTGLGDPTFLHPEFTKQPSFDYLAGIDLPLVYVPGVFHNNRFGPGWAWDDYPYYFSAERSGFPVFGNVIRINRPPGSMEFEIVPWTLGQNLEISRDTLSGHKPGTIEAGREEYSNRFRLSYTEPVDSIAEVIPFISDDRLICELLGDTLNREVLLGEKFPDVWKDIIYSQPVDSLLRPMMVESDNFFAEQLLLLCALVISDSLDAEKTIRFAETNYFSELTDGMYWVDGSGLSRYNQFTPQALTGILRMLYLEYGKEFIRGIFPEGGISGTMKKNFPGFIFAKTGSMSHVYNLSGYVLTRKGKWLIFSFMNNNFTVSSSEVRKEMARILLAVRDNL